MQPIVPKNTPEKDPSEVSSLMQKIESNQKKFASEFKENKIGKIDLNISLNELLSKIEENGGNQFSIENAVKILGLNYDLAGTRDNGDLHLAVFGKDNQVFNANRSNNQNIAGWVAQGDYSFGDPAGASYRHKDHWGVSVTPELKGTGLSDFLYNVKSLVDNQLEFEHVLSSNYRFLTFYIKKGYVPYSIIKLPELKEEVLGEAEINSMLNDVIDKRKNHQVADKNDGDYTTDYAIKLKLDPMKAEEIYSGILNLKDFNNEA